MPLGEHPDPVGPTCGEVGPRDHSDQRCQRNESLKRRNPLRLGSRRGFRSRFDLVVYRLSRLLRRTQADTSWTTTTGSRRRLTQCGWSWRRRSSC